MRKGWRTGRIITFGDRDPSKDEGFFGQDIFQFQFVSFSYNSRGESTVTTREEQLYKVKSKPQIGEIYVWRELNLRVYAITGSIVWLTQADARSANRLMSQQRGRKEWSFYVPADMQWYAISLPASGRFTVAQKGGHQDYAIQGVAVNNSFSLPSGSTVEISITKDEPLYIMATRRGNGLIETSFKLND